MSTKSVSSPPQRLVQGATVLLLCVAVLALALAAQIAWSSGGPPFAGRGLHLLLALGITAVCGVVSRLSPDIRIGFCFAILATIPCALAVDWWLSRPEVMNSTITDARKAGVTDFDTRSLIEVVLDAAKEGQDVSLPVAVEDFYGKNPTGEIDALLPFGGVPNHDVVLCNENGRYLITHTDQHGFLNPPGAWAQDKALDILLIGDSYTEGWCVPPEASLAGRIRAEHPATLNLGRGGLGSLAELAVLSEYLPDLRPRLVVWVFYDNDLFNLAGERQISLLQRYLDTADFRQHLTARQAEATQAARAMNAEARARLERNRRLPLLGLRHALNNLNAQFGQQTNPAAADPLAQMDMFTRVMAEAKRRVEAAGGRLLFVYLADYKGVDRPEYWSQLGTIHDAVMAEIRRQGIDAVDTRPLGASLPNPATLHNFATSGHYTATGYGIIAQPVLERIGAILTGTDK